MNKWLHKFLEKPDISDKPDILGENMENMSRVGPDKPDRFDPNLNMSGLSGSPGGLFGENLNNLIKIGLKFSENNHKPDISDNTDILGENMENMPRVGPDKPDRLDPNLNMSGLSGRPQDVLERFSSPYDKQDFEERLAIAEYDGNQTPINAHRIAYLDAFISVLAALPATDSQKDWLEKRIQTSLAWIEAPDSPVMLRN